ncbi:type II secretion system protein [Methylophilus sp. 13]|uniref:type II secretion system protein n=1 Tax=Methylophilus sp. 13 TaxID=2781018 RepID=UPI001890A96B|nr:type II secretion system protein [Methylophilus sp. 13]MBF5039420.1 type II secretion system protein [Methylophilus sp. 13]
MPCGRRAQGFILIGMFMLIMLSGLILSEAATRWQTQVMREREQELIKVGLAYRDAIGRYYNQTPGVIKTFPPTLEALYNDERFSSPRRHLRKPYQDPITQREGWGIVEAPSGGIMGIYSLSDKVPFKSKGYRGELQHLNDKRYYGEWYFVYLPQPISGRNAL